LIQKTHKEAVNEFLSDNVFEEWLKELEKRLFDLK